MRKSRCQSAFPAEAHRGCDPPLDPRQRPYAAYGGAAQLFYSREPEILLVGPAGTGKTRAVLEKLFLCAQKYAGMRALLARKTRASLSQSVLVTLEEKVIPENHPLLAGATRRYRHAYQLANRSELVTGSLDNADRIMSTEFDMIAAFEATELTLEDWEKLLSRLRNGKMPYQQAIADCNPAWPEHWLNHRALHGRMQRFQSCHRDNPYLWNRAEEIWTQAGQNYLATLERLSGVRRKRLLEGLWAAPEGLVYENFHDHIIPSLPESLPLSKETVSAGVDWGFREPMAVVVGVLCNDGCLYVVEEYYAPEQTLDDIGPLMTQLDNRWDFGKIFCDASRPDIIRQFKNRDLPATGPSLKAVDLGIAMVVARLRAGKLKILDRCKRLIEEARQYQYAPAGEGPRSDIPVKIKDHAMDALRYLITGLDYRKGADDLPDPSALRTDQTPSVEDIRLSSALAARMWEDP